MSHSEIFEPSKTNFLSLLSFLIGVTEASLLYVLSSYFAEVIGSDQIGIFYLIAYSASLISLFFLRSILHTFGRMRVLIISFALLIFLSGVLSKIPVSWLGAALLIGFLFLSGIIWVTIDIIIEAYSTDRVSGRVRGLHLTILNIGILFGPIISTQTLERFGFSGIFLVLVVGFSLIFLLALCFLRKEPSIGIQPVALSIKSMIQKIFQEKDLARIYLIALALDFFFVVMTIYMPIHLREIGMEWSQIGTIFTIMLIPFVILQYPLGWIADKKFGEKELLLAGIALSGISTIIVGFIATPSVMLWAGLLFATRIGAATIEVLRDSYFYKQIDANDLDIISFFRTTRPVANIFSALIFTPFLIFFPLQSVFFVTAGVFFLSFLVGLSLHDSESEQEQAFAYSTEDSEVL
jgi:MFS family permease